MKKNEYKKFLNDLIEYHYKLLEHYENEKSYKDKVFCKMKILELEDELKKFDYKGI